MYIDIDKESMKRVKGKWLKCPRQARWGDRLDSRFILADRIRGLSEKRILDLGCNVGVMLSELQNNNFKIGMDIRQDFIAVARDQNTHTPFVLAHMDHLPFKDSSFDAVIFSGMLEIPDHVKKVFCLNELARVLKKRGSLYLTTVNGAYHRYKKATNIHPVTYAQLQRLLAPEFTVNIKGFNPFPPFPYFLPNRIMANIPGIWRFLVYLMNRGFMLEKSCSFYVEGFKK